MAFATPVPTTGGRPAEYDPALPDWDHMLAHVDVLIDRRRIGPMCFEDAVGFTHALVRLGVPPARIRLVHARHPAPATRQAPQA